MLGSRYLLLQQLNFKLFGFPDLVGIIKFNFLPRLFGEVRIRAFRMTPLLFLDSREKAQESLSYHGCTPEPLNPTPLSPENP